MVVGNLQVVLVRHGFRVPQTGSSHVDRNGVNQLGLSTGSQVLPGLLSDFESGPANDLLQLRSEVGVLAPVSSDHELIPLGSQLNGFFKVR